MAKSVKRKPRAINKLLLYSVIGLVIVFVGLLILIHHRNSQQSAQTPANGTHIDYSPGTKADNTPNNTRKGSPSPSSTLENYKPPADTGSFTVTITRAGVQDQTLEVAAITRGASTGTCVLNVHQAGQTTLTQSEPLSFQVNSYVCPVMSMPLSQFPNRGQWNVSMTVESNGQTVTSDWSQNPVTLQ